MVDYTSHIILESGYLTTHILRHQMQYVTDTETAMPGIEDLILFSDTTGTPEEFSPENFKEGIDKLRSRLDAEAPHEEIKSILLRLKSALHSHPNIVHELLPEDIGQMTRGIKHNADIVLVKDKTKQTRKVAKKQMSREELAQAINNPPEDF